MTDKTAMHRYDVAIIGAGSAGSLAAAMLGRAGYSTCLVDPLARANPEFRAEKLEHAHIEALSEAGFLDQVAQAGRRYDTIWVARQGHLVEKRPSVEYGMDYAAMVDAMRDMVPDTVTFVNDKVVDAQLGEAGSSLVLGDNSTIEARLVVAATGLNASLLTALGIGRRTAAKCHSISIGFDVKPVGRDRFDFDSLTYFGEHPRHRVAYFTIFPMPTRLRGNLFVYRDKGDPWLGRFREDPVTLLHECMPRLRRLTGEFEVLDMPKLRPVDLVNAVDYERPGLVLIGDAWSTADPVSGTGASKAMVDAVRLCADHVPGWLAADSIPAARIAEFYANERKRASDAHSRSVSLNARRLALETGPAWTAYRWLRFAGSRGRGLMTDLFKPKPSDGGAARPQWQP
ncbi:NAD(P)/FAD-dependent oxidoreductase [Oricola sp.]|uniref:FAD-dependent oxidoreductase n=1 Tax=Oricola sp. TaxID=1979950 RepID=UPI0025D277E9|nr:NAD(P)/FAD-dependent oxidoreductase [Oricola sp.]MCI5075902.1 FAD-dependent monooxygenase [Oricola sp.]